MGRIERDSLRCGYHWLAFDGNARIMTPETATTTHYFYCNSRNYRTDDAEHNNAITARLAMAFEGEDKPMIEAQKAHRQRDLLDCHPALLSIDNASTRACRIYRQLVKVELSATESAAQVKSSAAAF